MSESFEISASTGSYYVRIEAGAFASQLARHERDLVIYEKFFKGELLSIAASFRAVLYYEASESI